MAEILPFPPARRIGYLRRQAAFVLNMSRDAGDRHIARQASIQRQSLLSKGVDPAAVEREVKAMESALRAELWRVVFAPGGAA